MTTLKETALAYEPPQGYKNIAELEKVSVSLETKEGKATDKDGKEFNYFFVEVGGEEYRVPKSVLERVKELLEGIPTLSSFRVTKKGEGLGTKYSVIPLQD